MFRNLLRLSSMLMLGSSLSWAGENEALEAALAAQPEEVRARYVYRHPAETLEFFGIEPGMTVVEALPGPGWSSRILVHYLGPDGRLIGADYAQDMWPLFGYFSAEFIASREIFVEDWTAEAESWMGDAGAEVGAYQLGSMPDSMKGTADAFLFIRALHNLARFEEQGAYLTTALEEAYAALKPGGILAVVQHRAPPEASDEWASGGRGYLKEEFVIERVKAAGFELVERSEINANPKDRPGADDVVWRLPPNLGTSQDDPELRADMEAIGESDRMTLKFRKPE